MEKMKVMEFLYMDQDQQLESLQALSNAELVELSEAWTEYQKDEYTHVPAIYREKWQKKQAQLNEAMIRLELARFIQAVKDGRI